MKKLVMKKKFVRLYRAFTNTENIIYNMRELSVGPSQHLGMTLIHFKFLGTVELENLPLRKTALQGLELPLEVKSGFIGRLKLSIPFRHPKSEPWIIHIDKLYLIAGPLSQYQVHNHAPCSGQQPNN